MYSIDCKLKLLWIRSEMTFYSKSTTIAHLLNSVRCFFLNDCGYIFCSKCWGKKPTKLLCSLICAEAQKFSEDGYEQHMQVNHLAPSLLSVLLLPSLIRGSPSRIINVNSVVSCSLTLQAPSMCSLVSMLFGMSKCWRLSDFYIYISWLGKLWSFQLIAEHIDEECRFSLSRWTTFFFYP